MMMIRGPSVFPEGTSAIVEETGANADMLQDFSIVSLGAGRRLESGMPRERAWLLMTGAVRFSWGSSSAVAERHSLLNEQPWVLHVPASEQVVVEATTDAELSFHATGNEGSFPPRLYAPEECRSELRGAGTMRETSTRIVRTVFDGTNAPAANLVLGEVVSLPGRWSSFPPHHHPQPEIYHYRFLPANGFGFATVGDEAHVVRSGDTTLIREGQVHPQAAAPGYAMWYLWVIRHLDGRRYRDPTFVQEHAWTMRADAEIWSPGGGNT